MISRRTLLAASLLAGAAPSFLPAVADEVDGADATEVVASGDVGAGGAIAAVLPGPGHEAA